MVITRRKIFLISFSIIGLTIGLYWTPVEYIRQSSMILKQESKDTDPLVRGGKGKLVGYLEQDEYQARDRIKTSSMKPNQFISSYGLKNETGVIKEHAITPKPQVGTTFKTKLPDITTYRGSNEISRARRVDSDKYIVYLCNSGYLCGGLGDRLKGIHSTFLLALALKRKFRIISTVPCDLYNQLDENQEPWHQPITPGLKNKTINMIDGYTSCGDMIFGVPNKTKVNFNETFPEPVLIIRTNQGWTHRFHEEPYRTMLTDLGLDISHFTAKKILKKIYNHLFKLKPNLLAKLLEFVQNARPKPGIKMVCAQIRIGYNPSIPRETSKKRRNQDEWLPVLWDFLSLYNNSAKYTLFITTDSQEIREYSQKHFPGVIMDTVGEITHVDRFENKDKACQGMEKTILDFTILANCDITVVSRSNFGKLSSELQSPASKLYTFQEGIIHEGPEGYQNGKVFNRTTKAFTDDCSKVHCPPPRNTRCAE